MNKIFLPLNTKRNKPNNKLLTIIKNSSIDLLEWLKKSFSNFVIVNNGLTNTEYDGNSTKIQLGGDLIQNTTLDVDDHLLEFTTAYGHNLIFTDDFLGQGWNFTGFYHNDAGIVYLNGIIDIFGTERSTVAVIDNVNGTNAYSQTEAQLAAIGYVPNMADITRVNAIQSSAQHNTINSSDNDPTKINVEFSYSNGDGTGTPVASVYRDGAVATDSGFYIGDKTTDGSWRFVTSGANLVIQKREAGSWVTKQTLI